MMYWAFVRRWLYLSFVGMWRGECAVAVYDDEYKKDKLKVIGSGKPLEPGCYSDYKIFWERKR